MRVPVFLWILFLLASPAFADRVCLERGTGKLVEYQSSASPGTLLQNAVRAGYVADQVEEKEVSREEWAALRQKWIEDPARKELQEKEAKRKQKEAQVKDKLGLSDQEFQALKEALGG